MLRKSRRVMVALLAVSAIMSTIPAVTLAGTQGSCNSGDNEKVRLWENAVGDTTDGNDSLWKCGSDANLGNDDHTLQGDCNRPWPPSGNWNDCVSSVTMWIPSGRRLCLYENSSYGVLRDSYAGPLTGVRHDVGAGWDDRLTSFKWVNGGEVNC